MHFDRLSLDKFQLCRNCNNTALNSDNDRLHVYLIEVIQFQLLYTSESLNHLKKSDAILVQAKF